MAGSRTGRGRRPWLRASALAAALAAALTAIGAAAVVAAPPGTTAPAAPGAVDPDWVPPIAAVAGLRLSVSLPPEATPQPLHATHLDHRPVIALILDRLADSRPAAGAATPSPGGGVLHIALWRGAPLAVHPAGDCPDRPGEAGAGYVCPPSPTDVVLRRGDNLRVRLHNPWMAAWLQGGWRAHFPVGEPRLLDREGAVALAREQSRLPDWQARFVDAYPVERSGGTEVRPAWLLEAELPAGQRIRLILDARTGEVLRLVQQEALE